MGFSQVNYMGSGHHRLRLLSEIFKSFFYNRDSIFMFVRMESVCLFLHKFVNILFI